MGYDNILVQVGEFGLYQKLLCGFFVFYTTFLCGLNYYTQVWTIYFKEMVFNLFFRCSFSTPPSTGAPTRFLTFTKKTPKHPGKTCFHGFQDKEDIQGKYCISRLVCPKLDFLFLVNVWWLILQPKVICSWTKPRHILTTSKSKTQTQTGSLESVEMSSALLKTLPTRAAIPDGNMTIL